MSTYGQLLDTLRVDPNDANSPVLQWFQETQGREIKAAKINAAGNNTYAIVSELLPGGFIEQPSNPAHGNNFSHDIVTKLYTPAVGRDFTLQSETQIYKLYGALITGANRVTSVGYGAEFISFDTVHSRCKPPDYDDVDRGMFATVVHRMMFTIRA
ncbi:MAG: hypothetical protein ACRCVX_04910 [Shewanella sp.]